MTSLVRLPVTGHSMAPALHPGDVLLVRLGNDTLCPGDIAIFRQGERLYSHRLLAHWRRHGKEHLLSKGDAHRNFDPLWPRRACFGVAVALVRDDETMPLTLSRGRRMWLVGRGLAVGALHRFYRWLIIFILLFGFTMPVSAAVHLTSFTATFQDNAVLVQWETASEVNSLGFNLYRRRLPPGHEVRLNANIIPAQGSITGAVYQFLDTNPPPAAGYQYRLEEIDSRGQATSFTPITLWRATATPTPSPTATPLPTATFTPTPTPTPLPTATDTPSSTPSPIPTATPTPTISPSPTSTQTPSPTPTSTLTPSPIVAPLLTPSPTPTPSPTLSPTATITLALSPSPTPSPSPSPTSQPTLPPSPTPSATATITSTAIPSPTLSSTPTSTPPLPPPSAPTPPSSSPIFPPIPTSPSTPNTSPLSTLLAVIGFISLGIAAILVAILLRMRQPPSS